MSVELGTVCWPGGADLDPYVRYSLVTGEPMLRAGAEVLRGASANPETTSEVPLPLC